MKTEILSPAGDLNSLKTAVLFGADAVYMGGDLFTMRTTAENSRDEIREGVSFAHAHKVKVYITVNTLPRNSEISLLPDYLSFLEEIGVDALIVADLGVMSLCKKYAPSVNIHMSTQTGIVNYKTADVLYEMGASRLVLARELSIDEITELRAKTNPKLEIEAFVHGSMCVSFSGRCLLSQYLVERDANRGQCAQPCRWGYHLMEEKRDGMYFPVFEDSKGTYILNSKDMCMIDHLDDLYKAGITSFKIEGRAKSDYYVAAVTNAYRIAADRLEKGDFAPDDRLLEELYKVSHREYYTGFYYPENANKSQCYKDGGYVRNYDVVAVVEGSDDEFIYLRQRNKFLPDSELDFLVPKEYSFKEKIGKLYDLDGNVLESANHAEMKLKIKKTRDLPEGTYLRKER